MEYKEKFIICLLFFGGSSIHALIALINFLSTTAWYHMLQLCASLSLAIPTLLYFRRMKEA